MPVCARDSPTAVQTIPTAFIGINICGSVPTVCIYLQKFPTRSSWYNNKIYFRFQTGLENRDYGLGIRRADHATHLYPQTLALTSPTSGGRSVGLVRSRTKATELLLFPLSERAAIFITTITILIMIIIIIILIIVFILRFLSR
jgi:hypothetical protein